MTHLYVGPSLGQGQNMTSKSSSVVASRTCNAHPPPSCHQYLIKVDRGLQPKTALALKGNCFASTEY